MIEDIIVAALAEEGAPDDHANRIAARIKTALMDAGVSLEMPPVYQPKPYPKWVGDRVVYSAAEEAALMPTAEPEPEPIEPAAAPIEPAQVSEPAKPAEPAAPLVTPATTAEPGEPTTEPPAA